MNQVTITLPTGEVKTFAEGDGNFSSLFVVQGCREDLLLSLARFLPAICTLCGEFDAVAAVNSDGFNDKRRPVCASCNKTVEDIRKS